MRKSSLLVPLAILVALAAGFSSGRHLLASDAARAQAAASSSAQAEDATIDEGAEDLTSARGAIPAAQPITVRKAASDDSQFAPGVTGTSASPRPAFVKPAEQRALAQGGMDQKAAAEIVQGARYEHWLDDLSRDADSDSLEMTRVYREHLTTMLKPDPRFTVGKMVCGAHLCALSASGPAGADEDFSKLLMAETKGPRMWAVYPQSVLASENASTAEYRLVFTIDPKYPGFVISP